MHVAGLVVSVWGRNVDRLFGELNLCDPGSVDVLLGLVRDNIGWDS